CYFDSFDRLRCKFDNSIGFAIVNACVNLGLLEKGPGIFDEMNVQQL
ncbi:hypothetical protein Tco_1461649, partial [Tanacetum coccineum]